MMVLHGIRCPSSFSVKISFNLLFRRINQVRTSCVDRCGHQTSNGPDVPHRQGASITRTAFSFLCHDAENRVDG